MSFEDRKKQEEARYGHSQELAFKIRNRRNKLFGLWIGETHLGLAGDTLTQYAKDVVMSDFERPGDEDVFDKVKEDLARADKSISDHLLEKHLQECEKTAREQVMGE